jgi:hypothetical protein
MKSAAGHRHLSGLLWLSGVAVCAILLTPVLLGAQRAAKTTEASFSAAGKAFNTPQQAADALVDTAEKFDVWMLEEIFGADGDDIVLSGEYPQDRQRAADFADEARKKQRRVAVSCATGQSGREMVFRRQSRPRKTPSSPYRRK